MIWYNYNIQEFRYDNKNKILFGLIDNFISDRAPAGLKMNKTYRVVVDGQDLDPVEWK